jgi:hypothetical protein
MIFSDEASSIDHLPAEEPFHIAVTIAYQNFECHTHAFRAYEAIVSRLLGKGEFKRSSWRFDLLRLPNMKQFAVRDALKAEIIIVCANEIGSLDSGFSSWLRDWSQAKANKPSAIVALFVGSEDRFETDNPLKLQLEPVAERLGLDFFAKTLDEEQYKRFE